MAKIKDILDLPLPFLKEALKEFIDISFDYWNRVAESENKQQEQQQEESHQEKEEEDKTPTDIKALIELNKAIVEKYQSTGAESLLKHLASKLASDRKCEVEDVIDELKEILKVDGGQQELLSLHPSERVDFVADKVMVDNPDLIKSVYKKEEGSVDKLKETVKTYCHNIVSEKQVLLNIQSKLIKLFNEWDKEE